MSPALTEHSATERKDGKMDIIAVDDEYLALLALEEAIRGAVPDCTLHGFCTSSDALAYARKNQVDIAFLDIEIDEMDGLALAKSIKDIYGKTNIVFATGFSHYAMWSYKVGASDYLLKPVTKEAVAKALERLRDSVSEKADTSVRVQTFGNFEVYLDGVPVAFSRSKSKELLAYLIDRQGASASTQEIAAILWEDREYDISLKNQTQTVISEMMKTLRDNGMDGLINKSWNQISVDRAKVSCDYYDLLNWELSAVNAYQGEYMRNYSWAEMTTAALAQKTNII